MGYTGEGEEFPTGVSASRARLTELGFDSYSKLPLCKRSANANQKSMQRARRS